MDRCGGWDFGYGCGWDWIYIVLCVGVGECVNVLIGMGIVWFGVGSVGWGCIGDDRFVVESFEGSEFMGKLVDL